MIGIITLGYNRGVWLAGCRVIVIHADEDDLLKSHVERKLEGHICYRCTFPDPPTHVSGEVWPGVGGVEDLAIVLGNDGASARRGTLVL